MSHQVTDMEMHVRAASYTTATARLKAQQNVSLLLGWYWAQSISYNSALAQLFRLPLLKPDWKQLGIDALAK